MCDDTKRDIRAMGEQLLFSSRIKSEIKIKGDGQECPSYTCVAHMRLW
jgi:hypothetical protein